ncbi:MAG: SDR family NAD(P)-dependent oxidoreductase [Candidatus Promineifilaceae bacterium]|nr:SDR family NAD(P)-dependent oxidoreductase [Candidatus Promineifilaceae bacterium]
MTVLSDKVALVTGAGRKNGIGAAIARELSRQGAHVVVSDICEPPSSLPHGGNPAWHELAAVAAELERDGSRGLPVKVDVTNAEDIKVMLARIEDEWGRLDILVNNAGAIIGPSPVRYMAEEAWRRMMEINATGVFLCCHHALPLMLNSPRGGRIINMASVAAIRPRIFMSAYAASKAAVIALTQSLAQEVGEFGITVNAILPGDVDTGMKQWGMQLESMVRGTEYDDVVSSLVERIPVGRIGTPEDVAALVAFLASPQADFISGQAIPVSGGRELSSG